MPYIVYCVASSAAANRVKAFDIAGNMLSESGKQKLRDAKKALPKLMFTTGF